MIHLIDHFKQRARSQNQSLAKWVRSVMSNDTLQPDSDYLAYGGPEFLQMLADAISTSGEADPQLSRHLRAKAQSMQHEDDRREAERQRASQWTYPREVQEAYAALELRVGAPPDEVRAAWRKMMQAYHPDRFALDPGKTETARKLASELNQASDRILEFWSSKLRT